MLLGSRAQSAAHVQHALTLFLRTTSTQVKGVAQKQSTHEIAHRINSLSQGGNRQAALAVFHEAPYELRNLFVYRAAIRSLQTANDHVGALELLDTLNESKTIDLRDVPKSPTLKIHSELLIGQLSFLYGSHAKVEHDIWQMTKQPKETISVLLQFVRNLLATGRGLPSVEAMSRLLHACACAHEDPAAFEILDEIQTSSGCKADTLASLSSDMLLSYSEVVGLGPLRPNAICDYNRIALRLARNVGSHTQSLDGMETLIFALGSLAKRLRLEPKASVPTASGAKKRRAAKLEMVRETILEAALPLAGDFRERLRGEGGQIKPWLTAIDLYLEAQAFGDVLDTFHAMRSAGVAANTFAYSSYLSACEKLGETELALAALDEMENPNNYHYSSAIMNCGKAGQVDKAMEILERAKALPQQDPMLTGSASVGSLRKSFTSAIQACAWGGHWRTAVETFLELEERSGVHKTCEPNIVSFNAVLDAVAPFYSTWIVQQHTPDVGRPDSLIAPFPANDKRHTFANMLWERALKRGVYPKGVLGAWDRYRRVNYIDVHNLSPGAAEMAVRSWLADLAPQLQEAHTFGSHMPSLRIITGAGKHRPSHQRGDLRETIEQLLLALRVPTLRPCHAYGTDHARWEKRARDFQGSLMVDAWAVALIATVDPPHLLHIAGAAAQDPNA